MARNNSKASAVRRWHRFFGAAAALFVAFMVLSGLSINHSHSLGFDRTQVSHPFLLGWYGLGEPENLRSYAVGSDWLSFAGSQLYLNDKIVASISDGVGAVRNGGMLIAAGKEELLGHIENGKMILSEYGEIVKSEFLRLPDYHQRVSLEEWVIMPNHVHCIIWLDDYCDGENEGEVVVEIIHELSLRAEDEIKQYRKHRRKMYIGQVSK